MGALSATMSMGLSCMWLDIISNGPQAPSPRRRGLLFAPSGVNSAVGPNIQSPVA